MTSSRKGIDHTGLDAAFEAEEARKSNLIMQARLLRDQGDDERASQHFAKAAEIEEWLSARCAEQGLDQKSVIHRFSAAGCWAHAGNFYRAITICNDLLAGQLPQRLQQEVANYAETLRTRRAQLSANLALSSASE